MGFIMSVHFLSRYERKKDSKDTFYNSDRSQFEKNLNTFIYIIRNVSDYMSDEVDYVITDKQWDKDFDEVILSPLSIKLSFFFVFISFKLLKRRLKRTIN